MKTVSDGHNILDMKHTQLQQSDSARGSMGGGGGAAAEVIGIGLI